VRRSTRERRTNLFHQAIDIIARGHASDLTIEEVARTLATSPRQLQRVFAESGNTTFRDELARARMAHARALLANGSLSIRDVAAQVGYQQSHKFANSFRRDHGVAPLAFRREARKS
jgi:transcriptional regulator GlxA family with amidase domain